MTDDFPWASVVRNLDGPSMAQAAAAMHTILQRLGEDRVRVAGDVARFVEALTTSAGRALGVGILGDYAGSEPRVTDLALAFSSDETVQVRLAAAKVLAQAPGNDHARQRFFAMLEDPSPEVQQFVLSAIAPMYGTEAQAAARASFLVLPDEDGRRLALDLIAALIREVKTLDDLEGLTEGQHQTINDLILPQLEALDGLLGSVADDASGVHANRKQSLIKLSNVVGAGKALVYGIGGLANSEAAVHALGAGLEQLEPIVHAIGSLL